MGESFALEMEVALRCAVAASKLSLEIQKHMVAQEAIEKTDRSPVTVADFGSQAVICRLLMEAFPSVPIVAEETSNELRGPNRSGVISKVTHFVRTVFPDASGNEVRDWIDLGTRQIASRYWCLDPIDGTKGFLRGDQYAVALALVIDGEVRLAVMACPNLPVELSKPDENRGTIFHAIRGEGAFQVKLDAKEAEPIRVSSEQTSQGCRFCESFEPSHADHDSHLRIARSLGIVEPSIRMDSQAKYGVVARGEASIYLRLPSRNTPGYREKVWDHAAGSLIIEEAGGRVTDVTGKGLDFGVGYKLIDNTGIIATNGRLHEAVLSVLADMRR